MSSLRSQLVYFLLRYSHLLQFRLKRPVWDENTSIPEFRQRCARANRLMAKLPDGVTVEGFVIGDLPAEWLLPFGAPKDQVLLYTIGGGYVSGSCTDHRSIVAKLSKNCGINTLLFEHRLAPEHPFPAAVEDAITAYRWLLAQGFSANNIIIFGESAGGGLCLATLLALRDQGLTSPAGAVALSPWTDLRLTGESYRTKAKVCLSPPGMAAVCSKYYVGDNDPGLPLISPLYGDLHGLPPLMINVGEYETMLDDSTRFAQKARIAGVNVTLRVGKGMIHCYPLLAPLFPEATQAMAEICDFIHFQLGRKKL